MPYLRPNRRYSLLFVCGVWLFPSYPPFVVSLFWCCRKLILRLLSKVVSLAPFYLQTPKRAGQTACFEEGMMVTFVLIVYHAICSATIFFGPWFVLARYETTLALIRNKEPFISLPLNLDHMIPLILNPHPRNAPNGRICPLATQPQLFLHLFFACAISS